MKINATVWKFICGLKVALALLFANCVHAQDYHFTYNANCTKAYAAVTALRINDAATIIQAELKADDKNLVPVLLANYSDFFRLFFNEDPELFAQQKPALELRIELVQKAKDTDPYKKFGLGMLHFQRALIEAKFKNFLTSVNQLRKAKNYFESNAKQFPNFHEQDIYLGTIQCIAATVPKGYKWLANLLGFSGSFAGGLALQQQAIKYQNANNELDNIMLIAYTKQYILNKPNEAWQYLQPFITRAENNRLLTFLMANIALNQNNATQVISILNANMDKPGFMSFPFLYYEKASAQMYQLDNAAIANFQKYLDNYKGKFYLKDAYQKMAFLYYLKGDDAQVQKCKQAILKVGHTEAEADKQAQEFASSATMPNKQLLQARLLTDGGYGAKSLNILRQVDFKTLKPDELLEYYYRYGRTQDLLGSYELALKNYATTYERGKASTTYFAARASLQSAMIFETENKIALARTWYNNCLDLGEHQYKNSIDQKAKAGLKRLEGK
jgi:hypothetical protein